MSAHVSVLELHQFVTRGESSAQFEAHVNDCASCARRLSDFARRAVSPVPVLTADDAEPRRLAAFVMAFAACLAVMLVQAIRVPKFDVTPAAPEGTHGVARNDDPRLSESIIFQSTGPTDSGAIDSGVR
ncbi:MAG: hypothetical protein QM817_37045 [Archangium sp.]